jgi:hypothetical protein
MEFKRKMKFGEWLRWFLGLEIYACWNWDAGWGFEEIYYDGFHYILDLGIISVEFSE